MLSVPYNNYIEDPDHRMPKKFISEGAYREAIEAMVIVCVDVVPFDRYRKVVYLAKRKHKPAMGWWWIGGRISAGEGAEEAACRIVKRETSLDVITKRFSLLSINRYFWKEREQIPQDVGSDNIGYIFTVELTQKELQQASQGLDTEEYDRMSGLQEFDRDRLMRERAHGAILDLYDLLFPLAP